jgi:phosphatidylglycerophosphate synthase
VRHHPPDLYHQGAGFSPQSEVTFGRAIVFFFDSKAAEQNVAGLPVAARAARQIACMGLRTCWIVVGKQGSVAPSVLAAVNRVAGSMEVRFAADFQFPTTFADESFLIDGPRLINMGYEGIAGDADWTRGLVLVPAGQEVTLDRLGQSARRTSYSAAERAIIRATAKPTDGIVSRHINRPVSQAISAHLLRLSWISPGHATFANVLVGLAMVAALVHLPAHLALIVGALLFQAASVLDGVDGEIARATFRESPRGAMLDSLVDAVTNLAFVAGVTFNVYRQNDHRAALAGAVGLGALAVGLCVIGLRARADRSRPFTFNEMKDRLQAADVPLLKWLTWITMRDFYALAAAVLVAAGFAAQAVVAFSTIALGWLAVVISMSATKTSRLAQPAN